MEQERSPFSEFASEEMRRRHEAERQAERLRSDPSYLSPSDGERVIESLKDEFRDVFADREAMQCAVDKADGFLRDGSPNRRETYHTALSHARSEHRDGIESRREDRERTAIIAEMRKARGQEP